MKTVFFNTPSHGHVNPTLAVTAELVKRGEQVIYYTTEEWRSQIEAAGAEFRPYPYSHAMEVFTGHRSGDSNFARTVLRLLQISGDSNFARTSLRLLQISEELLPSVLQSLRQERPDYVIFDSMAGWGKQAARRLALPAIASITTFVFSRAMLPSRPAHVSMRSFANVALFRPVYWQTARRIRKAFGVESPRFLGTLMNTGDLNIVFTSEQMQPHADKLGANFKFVGPSLSDRPTTVDFPFEQLTRRPLVYISLGTIFNTNPEFYRQCFSAFADHPGQFVLSAGARTDLTALGPIPPNFIVRNFVPQLDLLERSDLFITHGGMNSVHEGLFYGIPLLVVPQQGEQAVVARQVERNGAGLVLGGEWPFGRVSADELRAALERMLQGGVPNEQFRAAAARLGDALRAAGGPARAAEEIISFARRQREAIPNAEEVSIGAV